MQNRTTIVDQTMTELVIILLFAAFAGFFFASSRSQSFVVNPPSVLNVNSVVESWDSMIAESPVSQCASSDVLPGLGRGQGLTIPYISRRDLFDGRFSAEETQCITMVCRAVVSWAYEQSQAAEGAPERVIGLNFIGDSSDWWERVPGDKYCYEADDCNLALRATRARHLFRLCEAAVQDMEGAVEWMRPNSMILAYPPIQGFDNSRELHRVHIQYRTARVQDGS